MPATSSLATSDQRPATPLAARDSLVIFLVRHAEKVDDSRDPPLSTTGLARAGELVHVLRDAGITRIWSTDLLRTRHTAAPLAERLGIAIETYAPTALADFAAALRGLPGRHLVVGHSNTTPALVKALGGTQGPAIEDDEYDRLYVLVIVAEQVTTTLLRFGPEDGR